MIKLIFDTNVYDEIVEGVLQVDFLTEKKVKLFTTHIQIDELSNTPDADKRAQLFISLIELRARLLPTESFVIGYSRIELAKITDGDALIDRLERGSSRRTNDAIIGEVAIKHKLTLITNDERFKSVVKANGGEAMTVKELISNLDQ